MKSDFFEIFVHFQTMVSNQFSRKIKFLQSDNGGEFLSSHLKDHQVNYGIQQRLSCPHTPAQNGTAERKHRHVTEIGLAMLFHSCASMHL